MPADLTFFWNDRIHVSQPTPLITGSSVANGYAIAYAREAELFNAWKPSDSATTDEWLKVDGGSTTWLGLAGATAYFVVAYDARGVNQDMVRLQYGATDDGAFAVTTDLAAHTMDKTKVTCWYTSFPIPATAKRYLRLIQRGLDRSGGNVTAKILNWAMFTAADVTAFSTAYPGHSVANYKLDPVYRVSRLKGGGAKVTANKFGAPGQRLSLAFDQEPDSFFLKVRDSFEAIGGPERGIYVQHEGLSNAALADFFMMRLEDEWKSQRSFKAQSDLSITLLTEPWQ